jgi:quinol monooxygenase YgiN
MPKVDQRRLVSTMRLTVHPEKRREFFQTIGSLAKRIRKEKGCREYGMYEDTRDENTLILIGDWETDSSWDDHRRGDNFAVLVGSVHLLSIPASVDFKVLLQIAGIEAMAELHGSDRTLNNHP